jgi:xylulose-5-phosphate/fructose-6-phosphate phosphoketolase
MSTDGAGSISSIILDIPGQRVKPNGLRKESSIMSSIHSNGESNCNSYAADSIKINLTIKMKQDIGVYIAESIGKFLRDIMKLNMKSKNFRVFGPNETTKALTRILSEA